MRRAEAKQSKAASSKLIHCDPKEPLQNTPRPIEDYKEDSVHAGVLQDQKIVGDRKFQSEDTANPRNGKVQQQVSSITRRKSSSESSVESDYDAKIEVAKEAGRLLEDNSVIYLVELEKFRQIIGEALIASSHQMSQFINMSQHI